MWLHTSELYTKECHRLHTCCFHHVAWLSKALRPCKRRKRVRQAPTHTPAPYMHPICSYLVPVTRWLQNGIDYWFPSYHRSLVMAGFSGLTESLMWDNKGRGEEHKVETHTSTGTPIHILTLVWECIKGACDGRRAEQLGYWSFDWCESLGTWSTESMQYFTRKQWKKTT